MVYNPAFPLSSDLISAGPAGFNVNFGQLNTQFGVDHTAFLNGTSNGDGYHKKITLGAPLGADPGLASTISSIYTKTVSGASELFFQNGTLATDAYQLTNLPINSFSNTGTAGGSGSYIDTPWGLRLIWGLTNAFSGNYTVNCPTGTVSMLTWQCTANDAGYPTNGAVGSGTTITIGNGHLLSVRYLIIGTY